MSITEASLVLLIGLLGAAAVSLYRADNLILAALAVGLPLGAACLTQPRVGVYAYGFWQAWDSAVKFGGGTEHGWVTVAKLLALVVVITGSFRALASPRRIAASRRPFGFLVALCVVSTVSVAWSYAPAASMRFAAQMWLQLALAWVIVKLVAFDRAQMTRLMFWVVVGALSASAYVLVFGMAQRSYLRATLGDQANPVSVAAALATGLTCVPALWMLVSSRIARLPLLPVGLVILFAIFATGTRAAVAAIGVGFLSIGILSKGRDLLSRLALFSVSIVLVVSGMLAALGSGMLSEQSESRLRNMLMIETRGFDPNAGIPQGSRMDIWRMSLHSYTRTYFLGTGLGASPAANEALSGRYKDVHSSIVASLTELGPVGFFTFTALHICLLLGIRRIRIKGLQNAAIVIFVGFVLMGAAHTLLTTKWFWLPVTLLLAILELDARQAAVSAPNMRRTT